MARSLLPSEWNCLLWLSCPSLATAFLGMCGSNNIFQFIGLCTKRTHVQTQWETTGRESKILGVWAGCSDCMGLGLSSLGKDDNRCRKENELNIWWFRVDCRNLVLSIKYFNFSWSHGVIMFLHFMKFKSDRIFDVHWLMKWESFTIPSFEITSTASDISFRKDYVKPQPAHSGCIVGGRKKSFLKNNLSLRDW